MELISWPINGKDNLGILNDAFTIISGREPVELAYSDTDLSPHAITNGGWTIVHLPEKLEYHEKREIKH